MAAHQSLKQEKIAVTSNYLLTTAMEHISEGASLHRSLWPSNLPPLPEGLCESPEGSVDVDLPSSEAERLECLRDLGRTMQGGSILVLGRRRLYPVRAGADSAGAAVGKVCRALCDAALEALQDAIAQELLEQGFGLTEHGVSTLICRRGTLGVNVVTGGLDDDDTPDPEHIQRLKERKIHPAALRTLAEECAVNLSVSPGMQLVVERGLPPVLYQPTFVICVGGGQVRVLTFAFVGAPVTGDRPDRKRTPFSIRLATDDLVPCLRRRSANGANASSKLRYAAHVVDPAVQTTLDMIVVLEEELFAANEAGDWKKLAALEGVVDDDDVAELPQMASPANANRVRMESESYAPPTEISEGYGLRAAIGQSGPLAHQPVESKQYPGLPRRSRRFSWLLPRITSRKATERS
ncbi:unnamed protein product [Cladocopium goreaui]|uniref:Uncharacterized protein n=1 Tax=Cladocopium goreaui TaxID=2562237 RepID=A0A9P1GKR8_9DINO|nr:unnamed protein product [Cladocopium goreaui]